jgi:cyclopropane-fatty-acyl-phospholipid synthase
MTTVAERFRPFLTRYLGDQQVVLIAFWDGSTLGDPHAETRVDIDSPIAIRRLLYQPNELGFGRAYVAGDIDFEGDVFDVLRLRDSLADITEYTDLHFGPREWWQLFIAAWRLGAIGLPPPAPAEEARLRGPLHSKTRDAQAIAHHYDISNDFYRLMLGEGMTYSCAYFVRPEMSLSEAQEAKYELICRKLGLRPGMRLLDVGCGWGGMLIHAAKHHDVECVGVTLSERQADLAAKRIAETGVSDRVHVRLQDYRDVGDGPYDAISSIGMFEHVGLAELRSYFGKLFSLLRPTGRLLNHGISKRPGPGGIDSRSFIARYVFPDGELLEVGNVVSAMQQEGFEVRDVESLREHYALTLRAWVSNLESHWEEAKRLVGPARARIWRLYTAGSALSFEAGRINLHQVLGVRPDNEGASGMAATRAAWTAQRLSSTN